MINFKNITRRILRKIGRIFKKKKINISKISDKKLISIIGMELHNFYFPKRGQVRKPDYLKSLITEAEYRNLSHSENVKGAKVFLKNFKTKQNEIKNANMDFSSKNFFELAKKRKSIRKFSEKKILKKIIYQILECAIQAPSSCNRQSWRFLALNDQKSLSLISEIRGIAFLKNAPTVICVLVDKDLYSSNKELETTTYMDGAAAIMNIIHAAESLGISSCWVNLAGAEISKANMNKFYEIFKVEPNFKLISLVALGYGDQNIKKPKRELIDYYLIGEE